jgi:hypothetical protein
MRTETNGRRPPSNDQQTLRKPCGRNGDGGTLTLERMGECGQRRPASVTLRGSQARE